MKYLHVVPRNFEVMRDITRFIRRYFDAEQHMILFYTPCTPEFSEILSQKNVFDWRAMGKGKWGKYKGFTDVLAEADIILLHGFYFRDLMLEFYYTHRKYLHKAVWIGWGIDIYNWKRPNIGLKNKMLNHMDVACRDAMHAHAVLLETDTPVLQGHFGNKKKVYCAPYPFQADNFELMDQLKQKERKDETIRIQLGNNAFRFNNQVEIIDALARFRSENIMVLMPLTYGNAGHLEEPGHKERLIRYARKYIGKDKVKFMTTSIRKENYTRLPSTMDIGIFNAHRQNALGNVIRLSYMGKKVFLSPHSPLYDFLLDKGLEIYSTEDIHKMDYSEFVAPIKSTEPAKWIKDFYYPDGAALLWQKMFDEVAVDLCPEKIGKTGEDSIWHFKEYD